MASIISSVPLEKLQPNQNDMVGVTTRNTDSSVLLKTVEGCEYNGQFWRLNTTLDSVYKLGIIFLVSG